MAQQLWGGRFGKNAGRTNATLTALNCSLPVDRRLYAEDINASLAYAEALCKAGYLTQVEYEQLTVGLKTVLLEWIEGVIELLATDEDVHTANERRLSELVGEVAFRLHTGRSRNDQVVTDLKLWMRKAVRELIAVLRQVMEAMTEQAQSHLGRLMPGYTHLQRAQPVQFSHWLLSHAFALQEDCKRLLDYQQRSNVLPLGSGALAGNPLGVDRAWLAKKMGFVSVSQNSMHAVGDRDFVVDFIYCCSVTSLHLSRLAEDLILYTTREFDFITISDAYSTGSSLMPQKRNPDSLELVRGIAANICASLSGIMMTVKGTPSTYNKDLQFDKEYCFNAFDKLRLALTVTEGVVSTMKIKVHAMEAALSTDMLATDWAYYLVRKGIPFRKAHECIGALVLHAEKRCVEITEVPLEELQAICPKFDVDITKVTDYAVNVETYDAVGGTASKSVKDQVQALRNYSYSLKKFE